MKLRAALELAAHGLSISLLLGAFAVALTPCGGASSEGGQQGSAGRGAPGDGRGRARGVAMRIHCEAEGRPVSPWIYGIGARPGGEGSVPWHLGASARRWGGNHTSRYNWELGDAWNAGKDWYFENVDYDGLPGPAHRRFIEAGRAHGLATVLTVPMIGWVAKDSTSSGFPVSVFGPQRAVDPNHPDRGNGVTVSGALINPGSPERTSVAMPAAGIGRWVQDERARDGAGERGVLAYILDNEPTLWSDTHRDVHPNPLSYDELLARTLEYASAIRAADPGALIAGPAMWGWTAYFYSGVDTAAYPSHPDQDAHGGVPLIPWWLRGIAREERRTGTRLLDLLDVHFYPQGANLGIGTRGGTDPGTAARRLRSTRALWDPTYEDESWIGEAVELVPRLERWISAERPGLGISIGEYNFGAEGHMSGGLAVAEVLGRLGQLGVASAYYWDVPAPESPAFWAFRAFRNFDGQGAMFLGESVPADSSSPLASIFASRDRAKGQMVLVLLGLDPRSDTDVLIDARSCGRVTRARSFVYADGLAGFVPAEAPHGGDGGLLTSSLPAYSMMVLDLQMQGTP